MVFPIPPEARAAWLPMWVVAVLLVCPGGVHGYNRFWPVESLEPLSATYGAFDRAFSPASKGDGADLSVAFDVSHTGPVLDRGVRAALNLGVFGWALYQTPRSDVEGGLAEGTVWSLALPLDKGITAGYAFRSEAGKGEHDITAVIRPAHWLSLGLGVQRIGLTDPGVTAALSFRPFGDWATLSYQYMGTRTSPGTHGIFAQFQIGEIAGVTAKYDFKDLWVGLSFSPGPWRFESRANTVGESSNFNFFRHTAEWHSREGIPDLKAPRAKPGKPQVKPQAWVALRLRGALPGVMGRMDQMGYTPSLFEIHLAVDRILETPDVKGVYLDLDGAGGGWAIMEELRAEINRLRASGRQVVVFSESYSQGLYYAASAASRIFVGKTGDVNLHGLGFEGLYFRGLLDWVGVGVEVVKAGNYKSFGEPFARTNLSPYAREEEEHLLSVFGERIFPAMIKARSLKTDVDGLIAKGPYTAAESVTAGLVDKVLYREDVDAQLESEGVVFRPPESLFAKSARAWSGFLDPSVAVIEITGSIIDGESFQNPLTGESSTGSLTVLRAIDMALENPATRALLVRVDSGGGSVVASDLIWNALARVGADNERRLPVIASFGDMAASGGYYVAASAGRIFASPLTFTGSIGVIMTRPNVEGLLAKLKIGRDGVTWGPRAGGDSLYRPFTPEEREKAQADILSAYKEFLDVVKKGRIGKGAFKPDRVDELAQGRVWTGADALSNGLADQGGGVGPAADHLSQLLKTPSADLSWNYYNPVNSGFPGLGSLLGTSGTPNIARLLNRFLGMGPLPGVTERVIPVSGGLSITDLLARDVRSRTGLQTRTLQDPVDAR